MDKIVKPLTYRDTEERGPEGLAVMSEVWDHKGGRAGRGVVCTIGLRARPDASRWTHAVSEVTWGSVAYLRQPASSDDEVEAAHEALVAVLQGQPWPAGFDEAVRRWGVG